MTLKDRIKALCKATTAFAISVCSYTGHMDLSSLAMILLKLILFLLPLLSSIFTSLSIRTNLILHTSSAYGIL